MGPGGRRALYLPLPHSELLEDLEGCSSAGGIAECFVQRVSTEPEDSLGRGTTGPGFTGPWDGL